MIKASITGCFSKRRKNASCLNALISSVVWSLDLPRVSGTTKRHTTARDPGCCSSAMTTNATFAIRNCLSHVSSSSTESFPCASRSLRSWHSPRSTIIKSWLSMVARSDWFTIARATRPSNTTSMVMSQKVGMSVSGRLARYLSAHLPSSARVLTYTSPLLKSISKASLTSRCFELYRAAMR